jgi:hypothetical protein
MSAQLKYYLQKLTQILIPNQLCFDTIFALLFRNWLIIIIFALKISRFFNSKYSFQFSDVFHNSTPAIQK